MPSSAGNTQQQQAEQSFYYQPSVEKDPRFLSYLPSVDRTSRTSASSWWSTSESEAEQEQAPLTTVTIETTISYSSEYNDENDDDVKSDLSSISSGEQSLEELPPRSIFSSYWQTTGGAPANLRQRVSTAAVAEVDDEDKHVFSDDSQSHSTNTYERCTSTQHGDRPSSRSSPYSPLQESPSAPRRRIFQGHYQSAPDLCLADSSFSVERKIRKTSSTPALSTTPRPSCFSRRSRSCSDRSVSFSPQVQVVVFTPPTEQWAAKGWSDYFA